MHSSTGLATREVAECERSVVSEPCAEPFSVFCPLLWGNRGNRYVGLRGWELSGAKAELRSDGRASAQLRGAKVHFPALFLLFLLFLCFFNT